ncbi:hypothetical protein PIB30_005159 [Stylosanthes scabra]|uniref:Uncharacterized protein n=1 Tax=Stylosanthes scabra TaxID=79078 RepID=A0ABU6R499_9FABA|nr:hypothetical protein [Stylosanthes scabra]
MEEEALEELKKLEAQYPNQFEHLKNELRSFITQLQSDSPPQPENNNIHYDTQESTSLEQMKKIKSYGLGLALADKVMKMEGKIDEEGCELVESPRTVIVKHHHPHPSSMNKKRKVDRVDLVLERAQACLKKIRHLKTSLLPP